MALYTAKNGDQILDIIKGEESGLLANENYNPLSGSLVIVKGPLGFMLIKDKWRGRWEIVGGTLEPGENPRECAIRECFEESGYRISNLRFVGILKSDLSAGYYKVSGIDYAALYCADVNETLAFQPNDEITDLCWYNIGEPLQDGSDFDLILLEYYNSATKD